MTSTLHHLGKLPQQVFHLHNLCPGGVKRWFDEMLAMCEQSRLPILRPMVLAWSAEARQVRGIFKNSPGATQILVGVREPISLIVSWWFQTKDDLAPGALQEVKVDELHRWVMKVYKEGSLSFLPFQRWFEDEVETYSGVDIFSENFDIERGWHVYSGANANVGIIRVDRMTAALPAMLSRISEIPAQFIETISANRSSDKGYDELYRNTMKLLKFPSEFLEEVYASPYATTFWSSKELTAYKSQWSC